MEVYKLSRRTLAKTQKYRVQNQSTHTQALAAIIMASPVVIMCRGVELTVARDVLHRAPLLVNIVEAAEEAAVIELDRDPGLLRLILEFCSTGTISHNMQTDAFFLEAHYFGIGPVVPLLKPVRAAASYEALCYDAGPFS
jgi:hypothetical protein